MQGIARECSVSETAVHCGLDRQVMCETLCIIYVFVASAEAAMCVQYGETDPRRSDDLKPLVMANAALAF